MASFTELPPVIPFEGAMNAAIYGDFLLKQASFLASVAKLDEQQAFVAPNQFIGNGGVSTGGILLANNYHAFLDIQVASSNAAKAMAGGGNAAVYVQHYIDSSTAIFNNVNSGIRVQIETSQKRTGVLTNDVVAGYFGVRNNGTDVGAFGIHVDAYSNGAGAATTMYGVSAEMYREANTGFTVAFHARSIDAVGYFDNDYGFLASPSVAGTKKFKSIFAGGSTQTGTMNCDFGLDLRNTNAGTAQIAMAENHYLMWNGNTTADVKTRYETAGVVAHYVAGTYQFGIENTGRLFIVNNGNTVYGASAGPSGNFLAINIGGVVYKLDLHTF